MTRDTLAKTHQLLKKELAKQGVQLDGRSEAYKLVSDSEGETILYVALASAQDLLTEQQIEDLNAAGCLLDDGKPTRITFIGSKKQYAQAIVWSRLEKQLTSKKTEVAKVTLLERRIKTLEGELKAARDTSANELAMTQLMEALTKSIRSGGKVRSTVKAPTAKQRASDGFEGIATIALSDWHWGEVVDRKNVNGLNEYNLAVASRRADRIFDTTLALLDPKPGKYDALMVPMLGDMLSGIIHDELVMTNEASVIDCIVSLVAKLDAGLYELAQHFPALIVSCVFGNHGRMDKRKTFKNQGSLNYETLVYRMLEQQLRIRMGDACNIKFKIGTASDVFTNVYGKTFLYTHGDQFDAYQGSVFEKVRAGDLAKRRRAQQARQMVHDYLVCGHFHTYAGFQDLIMNGSLVGYNEFAFNHNMSIERPQQALFVNHPDFGITKHLPVFADDPIPLSKMIAPVSVVEVA
jgi:hypothetical protein